jgi:hypothetical protein
MSDDSVVRDRNQIACQLLIEDADLALLEIGLLFVNPDDKETTKRTVTKVRKTYDYFCKRRELTRLSPTQAKALQTKLDQLRARLRFFGESV